MFFDNRGPAAGRRAALRGRTEESPDSTGQGVHAGRCGIPLANGGKGKCHRNETAGVLRDVGKGETAVQETTVRMPRGAVQGKPRPEQDQIGGGKGRPVPRGASCGCLGLIA